MSELPSIDIKGKEYVMVNDRVKYFREHFPEWSINIDWVVCNYNEAICKCSIVDDKGCIRSQGTAMELQSNGFINKFSHIENAETSAVGRALGFLAIGIDTSIASFEEIANAIKNQEKESPKSVTKGTVKFKPEPTAQSARDRIRKGFDILNLSENEQQKMIQDYLDCDGLGVCDDLDKLNKLLEELVKRAIK